MRLLAALTFCSVLLFGSEDVASIIQRSAEANDRDFLATSRFNYKQTEKLAAGTRTTLVSMIDGSPYEKLLAVNGQPLDAPHAAIEERKQLAAERIRKGQSVSARRSRIARYTREQERDNLMISQLSKAFDFTMEREDMLNGFKVWVMKATPRAGYKPPSMQAQVLPGMQGEMWIDQKTYEWVKVVAEVIRPVSIDGFLAVVQPGTKFEIEKKPVSGDVWQIIHFSSHASAKVLHLFNHKEQDEITFFDFEPARP
jgi:hypothetical protein